jgi:hypothetical protein
MGALSSVISFSSSIGLVPGSVTSRIRHRNDNHLAPTKQSCHPAHICHPLSPCQTDLSHTQPLQSSPVTQLTSVNHSVPTKQSCQPAHICHPLSPYQTDLSHTQPLQSSPVTHLAPTKQSCHPAPICHPLSPCQAVLSPSSHLSPT